MIIDAVTQSGGVALATPEADIPKWMQLAASKEGIALCPETAVCLGALEVLFKKGTIKATDRILIFNTGASQKYPEAVNEKLPTIDIRQPLDWSQI
jgi:threonine synthase